MSENQRNVCYPPPVYEPETVVANVTSPRLGPTCTTLAIAGSLVVHAASSIHDDVFVRLHLAVLAHLRLAARLPHLLVQEPAGVYQSNLCQICRPCPPPLDSARCSADPRGRPRSQQWQWSYMSDTVARSSHLQQQSPAHATPISNH